MRAAHALLPQLFFSSIPQVVTSTSVPFIDRRCSATRQPFNTFASLFGGCSIRNSVEITASRNPPKSLASTRNTCASLPASRIPNRRVGNLFVEIFTHRRDSLRFLFCIDIFSPRHDRTLLD